MYVGSSILLTYLLIYLQIPNPLFDLAGITCGHFLVPFWTFFGATLIGKAIIKMHIQVIVASSSLPNDDELIKRHISLAHSKVELLRFWLFLLVDSLFPCSAMSFRSWWILCSFSLFFLVGKLCPFIIFILVSFSSFLLPFFLHLLVYFTFCLVKLFMQDLPNKNIVLL